MITRKLSKTQGYMVQVLATQLNQLQAQANDAQGALNEHAELLRVYFKLPDGEAQFTQGPDGWELRVTTAPVVPAEPDDAPKPGPSETKAPEETETVEAA